MRFLFGFQYTRIYINYYNIVKYFFLSIFCVPFSIGRVNKYLFYEIFMHEYNFSTDVTVFSINKLYAKKIYISSFKQICVLFFSRFIFPVYVFFNNIYLENKITIINKNNDLCTQNTQHYYTHNLLILSNWRWSLFNLKFIIFHIRIIATFYT